MVYPVLQNTPYALGLFSSFMVLIGAVLIAVGLIYLELKKEPIIKRTSGS